MQRLPSVLYWRRSRKNAWKPSGKIQGTNGKKKMSQVNLQDEFAELSRKLSDPKYLSNPEEYQKIAKGYGELKRLLAKAESSEARNNDEAIIEIRAGAGGDEASLFGYELFRMYTKYAERKGWKIRILDSRKTELGGIKEIIFELSGQNALPLLNNESGVHRVQRIPETEKIGRVHTSTVSVAVLPKARPVDVEIKPEEIKMDAFRASGPGGQNVNKTSSAVRITHLPTGIVVSSQEGRLQQDNRELAMTILRTKLLQKRLDEEAKTRGDLRKQQIGGAERSEKIRTYNFPQDRITDHRVKKNWSNIVRIMDGEIDEMIAAVRNAA